MFILNYVLLYVLMKYWRKLPRIATIPKHVTAKIVFTNKCTPLLHI